MYSQTRNGKTRFFETYIDPRTRMRKTVSVTLDRDTLRSRNRAQNLLNARVRELTAQPGVYSPVPLKDLTAAYLEHQKAHVAPQSVLGDTRALEGVKNILGENTDIAKIDNRYVSAKLDATDETPTRKNYRLKTIKKLFRWAYQYDYIPENWTDKLKRYKDNEKSRREYKYLEREELQAVLDDMKVEKSRLLTEFLALTGLRIGEALALTQDDIDIEARTITINKTFSLVTHEVGKTKTEDSDRVIHIQTELLPVVEKIPPECFKDINYPAYNKYLREVTKRTIGRALTPHALRHTHVSLLASCGVPLDLISHRCGHSDSDVTREIYLHVTQQMKDRDAAILDAICLMQSTKILPEKQNSPKNRGFPGKKNSEGGYSQVP